MGQDSGYCMERTDIYRRCAFAHRLFSYLNGRDSSFGRIITTNESRIRDRAGIVLGKRRRRHE